MLKALVIKELRESVGVFALAAFVAIVAIGGLMGYSVIPIFQFGSSNGIPFVSDSVEFSLRVVIGGLALALGLKQASWEFAHNTYYFLLHRPIDRSRIFWIKLAIGAVLLFGLGSVMILIYAAWAANPGSIGTPFYWSMTVSAWRWLICLSLVYLSAFLCGIRPARWFGTRLAPAATGIFAAAILHNFPIWAEMLGVAVIGGIILTAIFYYVRERDY